MPSLMRLTTIAFIFIFTAATAADMPLKKFPAKDPSALINNELARLDTLIQATQQSLEGQKQLRSSIEEYKKIQEQFFKQSDDNDILFSMVKSAHRTLKLIKDNHLTQSFDPEFIDELTVLAQAANKRGIPKP